MQDNPNQEHIGELIQFSGMRDGYKNNTLRKSEMKRRVTDSNKA